MKLRHPNIYLKEVYCGRPGCKMCPHPGYYYMNMNDKYGQHNIYLGKEWNFPMLILNEKNQWKKFKFNT